jgi:SAM-dependent methyltransferase
VAQTQLLSRAEQVARGRIETIGRQLELSGKVVLEFPTGRGYLAALLPSLAGARRVVAIDSRPYPEWESHDEPATRFVPGDLTTDTLVDPESFDVAIAVAPLGELKRPVQAVTQLYRALREGGRAYLHLALYPGPRVRDGTPPWTHLISVEADGGRWANRMTAATYVQTCSEVGFEVSDLQRHVAPLEELLDTYLRYEETLGRYPALDLETDYLTLVLRKLPEPSGRVPELGYAVRQRWFERLLAERVTGR